jgi:hypothetical protein
MQIVALMSLLAEPETSPPASVRRSEMQYFGDRSRFDSLLQEMNNFDAKLCPLTTGQPGKN